MKVVKFNKEAFDHNYPKGWHVFSPFHGGEFTLCGVAFDGDAVSRVSPDKYYIEKEGKPTCEDCIALINFCKAIKL